MIIDNEDDDIKQNPKNSSKHIKLCCKIHPSPLDLPEILQIKKLLQILKNRPKIEENSFELISRHPFKARSISLSPNSLYLLITFQGVNACICDITCNPGQITEIPNTEDAKTCDFSSNSSEFAIGCKDIQTFSTKSLAIKSTIPRVQNDLKFISYIKDNKSIFSLSSNSQIQLWDLNHNRVIFELDLEGYTIFSACISPEKGILAVTSLEKQIRLWDISDKNELSPIDLSNSPVRCALFINEGENLVIGSQDRSIKVINIKTQKVSTTLRSKTGYPVTLSLSQDPNYLLAGLSSSCISMWACDTWSKLFTMTLNFNPESPVVISKTGAMILSVSKEGAIKLIRTSDQRINKICDFVNEEIANAGFSSDHKLMFCTGNSGIVRVFELDQYKERFNQQFVKGTIEHLAMSKLNKYLVVIDVLEQVKIWNLIENFEEFSFSMYGEEILLADFIYQDQGIVFAARSGNILFKKFENFQDEFWFKGHKDAVTCICASDSASVFASGSADCSVRLWNLTDVNDKVVFKGHENEIVSLQFSNNGYLVSGAIDGEVKFWNLKERFEEFSLSTKVSNMRLLKLSQSADQLFVLTLDNYLNVWDVRDRCESYSHDLKISSDYDKRINFLAASYSFSESSIKLISSLGSYFLFKLNNKYIPAETQGLIKSCPNSYSNDSKFYAFVSGGLDVIVINLKKNFVYHRFVIQGKVNFLTFTQDDNFFIAVTDDSVKILNLIEKKEEYEIEGKKSEIISSFIIFNHMKNSYFLLICFKDKFEIYKNHLLICKDHDFDIESYEIQVNPDINFEIIQKNSNKSLVFDISTEKLDKLKKDSPGIKALKLSLIPKSIYQDLLLAPLSYLNTFSSLVSKDYQSFQPDFYKLRISNLNLTVLHLFSYLGKSEICDYLLKTHNPYIQTDLFGHSPLFYSIIKNHQSTINSFLLHISKTSSTHATFSSNIFSLRNDFIEIIKNSSTYLPNLLSICLEKNKQVTPTLIQEDSTKYVHISNSSNPFPLNLLNQIKRGPCKLVHPKTCYFHLAFGLGSSKTLSMLESINNCGNEIIYKTEFIQFYLMALWKKEYLMIFIYSLLLWMNLVWIAFIVEDNFYLIAFSILLLIDNILLLAWEGLVVKYLGFKYYYDWWNVLDFFRILLTTIWVIMKFFGEEPTGTVWAVVFLNIIRGLVGFRAFDLTRFYIKLIYKSLTDILSFMLIFIYSILAFGLLNATTQNKDINFESLWMDSFAIIYGDKTAMFASEFGFQYVTFVLATWINVVFLLKIIISIFGNSFSVFKEKAEIYNYQEMAEVLLETNQVFASFCRDDELAILHAGGIMDGKVFGNRDSGVEADLFKVVDQVNALAQKFSSLEKKFKDKLE